jgi:hypothetical protein
VNVATTAMADAWLEVDHQAMVWCNQIAIKVNTQIHNYV